MRHVGSKTFCADRLVYVRHLWNDVSEHFPGSATLSVRRKISKGPALVLRGRWISSGHKVELEQGTEQILLHVHISAIHIANSHACLQVLLLWDGTWIVFHQSVRLSLAHGVQAAAYSFHSSAETFGSRDFVDHQCCFKKK